MIFFHISWSQWVGGWIKYKQHVWFCSRKIETEKSPPTDVFGGDIWSRKIDEQHCSFISRCLNKKYLPLLCSALLFSRSGGQPIYSGDYLYSSRKRHFQKLECSLDSSNSGRVVRTSRMRGKIRIPVSQGKTFVVFNNFGRVIGL